jgi:tetratricopeptide (TPR) repeat protein
MWSGGSADAIARVRAAIEHAMPHLEAADHLPGLELGLYLLAWLAYHRGDLAEADARMVRVQDLRAQIGTGAPAFVAASLLDGPTPLEESTLRRVLLDVSGSTTSWQAERTAQIAGLYALRGDVEQALRLGAAALELAEALELPSTLGAVEIELGVAQIRLARYGEAIELLDRAQRAFAEAGDGNFRSTALGQLARAQVFAGDATAALGSVELALDLGDEEDLLTQIASRSAEGLARASAGDAGGVAVSREAVKRARGTELLVPFCDSLSDLAHACIHAGDRAGAAEAATEAVVGFESKHAWGAATSLRDTFGIRV